jgi:hypothetical protein
MRVISDSVLFEVKKNLCLAVAHSRSGLPVHQKKSSKVQAIPHSHLAAAAAAVPKHRPEILLDAVGPVNHGRGRRLVFPPEDGVYPSPSPPSATAHP